MTNWNLKVPFINDQKIKEKADKFREKYWNDRIPVDIEKIIDVFMRIDVIPVPELWKLCNALFSSDWKTIYVDNNMFNDDRFSNRLRFSYAHEVGHFILHKEVYEGLDIDSFEDFYDFLNNVPGDQYSFLETQANKFASYLLVPRKVLEIEKNKILIKYKEQIQTTDRKVLNSYIANPLSAKFGISAESMEIVLNNEN